MGIQKRQNEHINLIQAKAALLQMESTKKSLQEILDSQSNSKFGLKKMIGYTFVALITISVAVYLWPDKTNQKYTYKTEKITTGALTVTVSATGKLRPTNQVEVGSELSELSSPFLWPKTIS